MSLASTVLTNTACLFLAFVVGWAVVLCLVVRRYRGDRGAVQFLAGLALWLVYAGTLSVLGVLRIPDARPPGIVFVVAPLAALVLWAVGSRSAGRFATSIPLTLLIGLQAFRIVVEVFLHQLWFDGIVPKTLTFEGDNVDLWIGLSAPVVAWVAGRGPSALRFAVAWNVVGLASLANVVVRSVLTAPGPFHLVHGEVLNRAIGTFPYTYIAAFLAPGALLLHVLCLRAINARRVDAREIG